MLTVQQAAMAAAEQAAFVDANPADAQRVAAGLAARGGLTAVSVELTTTGTSVDPLPASIAMLRIM